MESYDFTGFWEIPGFEFEDYGGQQGIESNDKHKSLHSFEVDFEFDMPQTTTDAGDSWLDGMLFGWGEVGDVNQQNVPTTTQAPVRSQDQDLEYILLSMFGAIVAIFILCQMIIYLKNCTEKRHTWRIGRRRWWNILKRTKHSGGFKCGGITIPSTSNTIWAHTYDPYEVVPCRPGLAYTARPTSLYSDLDYRGSSTASSERGSYREGASRSSRSFSSTTVFMVDPRGHYTSRLSASPEISLERERSSSSGSGTMPADNSSSGSDIAIARRPAIKRGNRGSRMISTAVQCESVGYDTDSSFHDSRLPPQPRLAPGCARRSSSTTSNRSTISTRSKVLALRKSREASGVEATDAGNNNEASKVGGKSASASQADGEQRQPGGETVTAGDNDRDSHHSDISLTSVSSMSGMSSQANKRAAAAAATISATVNNTSNNNSENDDVKPDTEE